MNHYEAIFQNKKGGLSRICQQAKAKGLNKGKAQQIRQV